ncbi:MAG TPA: SGNH/GDSL hydrolase family protein [Candidatus Binatia bacterium]|jgi:thermolabile hemolysin|nr:SGNH/GDSL hydrolase family protein [Candidatus Binatia bacterium]
MKSSIATIKISCLIQLLVLAFGLRNTPSHAQLPPPSITALQFDGTNIVVTAQIPVGARCATLEGRPGLKYGPWAPRAVERLDGSGSSVTFHMLPSRQMEMLRVRAAIGAVETPRMIVFGDSLSDTGRHLAWYGTPAPPYFNGRYSDGPVWVEYLATDLGFSPNQYVNYAVGGAASGHDNSGRDGAPGLLDEVDSYRSDITCQDNVDTNALYVLWIGANDFEIWSETHAYTNHSPDILVAGAIENVQQAIESLADLGAQRFLVANLPDLGKIPHVEISNDPKVAEIATLGTIGFNENLAWLLGDLASRRHLNIVLYDVFSLYEAVRNNPASFGLTNGTMACWLNDTNPPCPAPANYLFWDDRHPTTAAHRLLAQGALAALQTGGLPLPSACALNPTNLPGVKITTSNGEFTTNSTIQISGTCSGLPPGAIVHVNGTSVTTASDGSFTFIVNLNSGDVANPIVAELVAGNRVLARDRIVVFQGASLQQGDIVPDAVVASLNTNGVSAIRDVITADLTESGAINLAPFIPNPLKFIDADPAYAVVQPSSISYSCFTVDAEPHAGYVRLRFSLHDILVNYHLHAWLDDLPDPGFDCDGGLYVGNFHAYLDVALQPSTSGSPGEVVVTPLSEIQFELVNFQHLVYQCDLDDFLSFFGFDLDSAINDMAGNVEQDVRNAISNHLGSGTNQRLAKELQRILASVSISGALGNSLGVSVGGNIQTISMRQGQVDLGFEVGLAGTNTPATQTYAFPTQPMQFTSFDPAQGRPYDFAVGVSLETLNQFLVARSDLIPLQKDLTELDFGTQRLPLTAGLLSLFFPSLRGEDPQSPFLLRLKPTLPPMFVNDQTSSCGEQTVEMDQLMVELVDLAGGQEKTALAFVLDLGACVNFGFDSSKSALTFDLGFATNSLRNLVVTENHVCAHETVVTRLMSTVLQGMMTQLAGFSREFNLPHLGGVTLSLVRASWQNGYVTFYLSLTPPFGRPDLTVASIQVPDAVDVNFPFDARVLVKNIGHAPALGGVWVGVSLSADGVYTSANNVGIGLPQFFSFAGGSIGVGEAQWFTLSNLGPAPGALEGQQTLFVTVDVPPSLGGAGLICESSEMNNFAGVPIRTTRADAYVVWVQPPAGLVGAGVAGAYQVRVGRNNVGIDMMQIPFRVSVGNPALTWQDGIVSVPRGGEATGTVYVPTPPSVGPICVNATNYFPVTACANLPFDPNPSNNCQAAIVAIAVPYFDLRYDITGPINAHVGDTVGWTVTVRNAGNMASPVVCSRTGIGLNEGDDYLNLVSGSLQLFNSPPLAPGDSVTLPFSAVIPPGAATNQFIKAGVDTFNGCLDVCPAGNQIDKPISICGADLDITGIEVPADLVGGVGPRTYYVTVHNDGCDPASNVWVRTCLATACRDTGPLNMASGATITLAVSLPTPASTGIGGQTNYFAVTACLNGWVDATPTNNCRTEQAGIAVPYWDLHFSIETAPSAVHPCTTTDWVVRATNAGNTLSDNVCFISGIGLYSGAGNWAANLGLSNGWTGQIPPGQYHEIPVNNYQVGCGAFPGTQYIKAEINYAAGCNDIYSAGNYAEQSVQVGGYLQR